MLTSSINNSYVKPIQKPDSKLTERAHTASPFSGKISDRLDSFFNLGRAADFDMSDMSNDEKETYLKTLAALLKEGIVGYDYYEVNGRIEKRFITTQIGRPTVDPDERKILNYKPFDRYM
ncbi:MAG: hypothetical protein ACLFQU_07215 [Candidatus Kapaibacterium sp.]